MGLHQVERALHRDVHSPHNVMLSILDDARFVSEIRALYSLPTLANLRAGAWYQSDFDGECARRHSPAALPVGVRATFTARGAVRRAGLLPPRGASARPAQVSSP